MSVQANSIAQQHTEDFSGHFDGLQKQPLFDHLTGHRIHTTLVQWLHNHQTRRQLAQLSDRILIDIGLSPEQVQRELSKKFWQN